MIECVFDFETDPIDVLPNYPPKPQGLAIMVDGAPLVLSNAYYHAWGHPSRNNAAEARIRLQVLDLIANPDTFWIAHNLAFDASIMEKHWGFHFPWDRAADTMLLAFLDNPYGELGLKPLSEKIFQTPSTEQDAVQLWLIQHGVVRANDKQWGAHICKAPGDLVGAYAFGDIERTRKLYHYYKALGV